MRRTESTRPLGDQFRGGDLFILKIGTSVLLEWTHDYDVFAFRAGGYHFLGPTWYETIDSLIQAPSSISSTTDVVYVRTRTAGSDVAVRVEVHSSHGDRGPDPDFSFAFVDVTGPLALADAEVDPVDDVAIPIEAGRYRVEVSMETIKRVAAPPIVDPAVVDLSGEGEDGPAGEEHVVRFTRT